MNQFERLWLEIKNGNWKVILSICILIALLILMLKGCSNHSRASRQNNFKIAFDATWYPLQIPDKEKNMVAFSTELLLDIADEEHLQIELIASGTDSLLDRLDNGDYDAILSGMQPDAMHNHYYTFSNPYFLLGPVLVVAQNSPIHSFQEMAKKTVGIRTGTFMVFNVPQPPSMIVITYDYMLSAFADLEKGLIDGVILDLIQAYSYTSGFYAGRLRIATAPLSNTGLRLLAKRTTPLNPLIEHFNDGLDTLKETGAYKELLLRWDLFQTNLIDLDAKK